MINDVSIFSCACYPFVDIFADTPLYTFLLFHCNRKEQGAYKHRDYKKIQTGGKFGVFGS